MCDFICELPVDHVFFDSEKDVLYRKFSDVKINPYRHYPAFREKIRSLRSELKLHEFDASVAEIKRRDKFEFPFVFFKNSPTDKVLPVFSFEDPVHSKHFLKRTFIAEAFLSFIAESFGTEPIGYLNVNDGDVFQDIYPKESMQNTQSQKALKEINFHKDLANHFVRPDSVNMLCMRSAAENQTITTFVRNKDVLAVVSARALEQLKLKDFHTPFDDLTVSTGNVDVGAANLHEVISGDDDIRFFECRTRGMNPAAESALSEFTHALHKVKRRVHMAPGDFISVCNNHSLHGKELGHIGDATLLRTRWMIKTVNVDHVDAIRPHLVNGSTYMVNG